MFRVPRSFPGWLYIRWLGLPLVAALALLSACAPATDDGIRSPGPAQAATQSQAVGQVTVTATWRGRESGPVFTVVLDTHSVDLDSIDLAEGTVLRTSEGEVTAIAWTAPKGGHHRSGELTFPTHTPDGRPTLGDGAVELVVRDLAGVAERSFRWPS